MRLSMIDNNFDNCERTEVEEKGKEIGIGSFGKQKTENGPKYFLNICKIRR